MEALGVDLQGLRAFAAVARKGSFHEAAVSLNLSPPALTRRVQRLEKAVGSMLFERTTRRVLLTPPGEALLSATARVLEELDAGLRQVRAFETARTGHVSITCSPTVTHHLLPCIIRDFLALHPDIRLRVQQAGAAAVVDDVRQGTTEFGITFFGANDDDLTFEPLLIDPYCLVCPVDHPLAALDQVAWTELRSHRLITAGPDSGNMLVLDQALRGIDWRPTTSYEINHLTTALGLVEVGLGIAVIPRSALPTEPLSAITTRPLVEPAVTRTLGLIRRRSRKLASLEREFLLSVRRTSRCLNDGLRPPMTGPDASVG
jgi:DNA-binding transcriptional LysR family regulator